LAGLRRSGKVEPWNDHDIRPGEEWDHAIKKNLADAEVIILLVSADFINTDYIWEVEIKAAMERHERGEAVVIPVFVKPCDWQGMPFGKLNGLPSKARPVTSYPDPETAWLEVVEGIKRVLNWSW
ncbi:MAG TPA: toll/interleukin-1 receptor domain-containing protein, partial [Saprospiraceae bacterium]|nr:toll/interleukin-1 receptor domain-containing protein [Saprospiraceae bacterium]